MIREYGAESKIWFKVRNSGDGTSPGAEVRLYIDDILRATVRIPQLNAGEEYEGNFSYVGVCSGKTDTIKVIVDPRRLITETNKGNNVLEEVWNCTVESKEMPDLIIRRAWLEPLPGYNYRVGYEIVNQGQGYACGSHTGLYVDNTLIAEDYVDRLAPGESVEKVFKVNYSMSQCTPPSDTIQVVADYNDNIEEISEDNNGYSLPVECLQVPARIGKPDLTV